MVVLVLLTDREGRLLEQSDYSMDGLFSPGTRSAGRPLLSPRWSAHQFSVCHRSVLASQAIWVALLTQRNIEEAEKAAGIDPWRRVGNDGRNSRSPHKELPPEYAGERHIVTVGRDEDGNYRWEERLRRAPANEDDGKLPPLRVIIV